MPVQFADSAWSQAHVDARDRGRCGKLSYRDLAGPVSGLDSAMLRGERAPEIRRVALVRRRRDVCVGLHGRDRLVVRPGVTGILTMLGLPDVLKILLPSRASCGNHRSRDRCGSSKPVAAIVRFRIIAGRIRTFFVDHGCWLCLTYGFPNAIFSYTLESAVATSGVSCEG